MGSESWATVAEYVKRRDASDIARSLRRLSEIECDVVKRSGLWCVVVPWVSAERAKRIIWGDDPVEF